ncbi:MAG: tachylectin-related carbohydrate-binding protein [Actinomycetota bacterium]
MKILKVKNTFILFSFLMIGFFGNLHIEAQEPRVGPGVPIYAIKGNNGNLLWYKHLGFQNGDFNWANNGVQKLVGLDWEATADIFKGDPNGQDGVIYRVDRKYDLYWYKHNGYSNGTPAWENGKKIGSGWRSRQVISGGGGILYSLQYDGTLLWQKHKDYYGGSAVWANNGVARKVGAADDRVLNAKTLKSTFVGWNTARIIFSEGYGTIYMIDNKGDLYWNRHLGYLDGTDKWDERKKIGSGWQNMRTVFAGGDGIIYAVDNTGKLFWYKHTGMMNGANFWVHNTGREIGNGWLLDFVF